MKKKGIALLLSIWLVSLTYGDEMTLKQVVDIALENNLQIKLSEKEIKTSETKKMQAQAAYWPKVKLSGGYMHFSETPDTVKLARNLGEMNNGMDDLLDVILGEEKKLAYTPGVDAATKAIAAGMLPYYQAAADKVNKVSLMDDGLNYQVIKLSFDQPVYTGGKLTAVNKQADISVEISRLIREKNINEVTYDVKKSFNNVIQAKRALKTANEAFDSLEKHVKEAEAYYKAGMIPKLDVVRANAKLSEIKQKVVTAENAVNLAKSYLSFVIGKELPEDFEPQDNISFDEIKDNIETLQKTALENRPEIKVYTKKIELAAENRKTAESQGQPLIALTGEYKHEATNIIGSQAKWQVGLVGSLNLFDGGAVTNQVLEAEKIIEQAKTGRQLAEESIKIEVKQAYLNTVNALENIKVAEKTVEQAKETLRMAAVNYAAGMSTSMERIDAEVLMEQANNNYDTAASQYIVAKSNLEKAIGKNLID